MQFVPMEQTADLWWKNAILYCLDVETFQDSDGDGIGDLQGLTARLDHLAGLGVTCVWLMPFYPTPNDDDGYDVADFYSVDPRLGHLGDFADFVRTARDRGMRVIVDLVVNHTSVEHPWFRAARADPDSRFRDFYVWQDEIPEHDTPEGEIFPGEQDGLWEWDEQAGQYYLHRFYKHQPDLNVANPEVREELRKVVGFWLAQGLSGFRVDAVPFFLETEGIDMEMDRDPHEVLRELCAFLARRSGEAIMLGEVNLPPDEARAFFGDEDGDELQMLFNFVGMQATYLSLARQDVTPLVESLRSLPDLPTRSQWASFLRNHDELTLDKLTDDERQEVFDAFGPDEDMQLYDRGLRRRLPPMVAGDPDVLRCLYSLMFTMPGTPTLFYGEEIGMGENLAVDGRRAVRTPMQWTDGPSAGFSTADPSQLRRPVVDAEGFRPQDGVNVAAQRVDRDSLLNWFESVIRHRKDAPEIGFGEWSVLDPGASSVLAMRYDWGPRTLLTLHNLSSDAATVRIEIDDVDDGTARDVLTDEQHDVAGTVELTLAPWAYRWLRLT